ncbi:DUF2142 domain-containing protein [Luteibacter sp. CQ10]|uniref:DUF2142 domain-containing protein n=1 Tax=Luteibacter sp. CQ10 TaxID=2805821 RepID=UPI0034A5398B
MIEAFSAAYRERHARLACLVGLGFLCLAGLLFWLGTPTVSVTASSKSRVFLEVFLAKDPNGLDERHSAAGHIPAGETLVLSRREGYAFLGFVRFKVTGDISGASICSATVGRPFGRRLAFDIGAGSAPAPEQPSCAHVVGGIQGAPGSLDARLDYKVLKKWRHQGRRIHRASLLSGLFGLALAIWGRSALGRGRRVVHAIDARMRQIGAARLYLCIAIPFGIAFLLVKPVGSVPDELAHMTKAVTVSQGVFLGQPKDGGIIPIRHGLGVYDAFWGDRGLRFHWSDMGRLFRQPLVCEPANAPDAAVSALGYPPLPYLMPAAIFRASCAAGWSLGAFYYLAALLNLLLAVGLTYAAIQRSAPGEWAMATVALLPITLFLSASFSSDALTLSLSFLFAASIWQVASGRREPDGRTLVLICALAWGVALTKPGYVWLVGLGLSVLPKLHSRRIRQVGFLILGVMGPLVLHVIVVLSVAGLSSPRQGIVPADNVHAMLSDPLHVLVLWVNTFISDNGWYLLRSAIGRLEWRDVTLSTPVSLMAVGGMLLSVAVSRLRPVSPGVPWVLRTYAVVLGLAGAFALSIPLYVTWTSLDAPFIQGLQGRYFLVVVALLLLSVSGWRRRTGMAAVPGLTLIWVLVLAAALATLYNRWYGI